MKIQKKSLVGLITQFFVLTLTLSLTLVVHQAHAAIPQQINYQGYLTNASGVPINGTVNMTFRIFDVLSGGSFLWTETQNNVPVTQGVYNVTLGSQTPIGLSFNAPYFLEIEIGGEVLSPRKAITSVGYAFRALTVETIGSHAHSGAEITSGTVAATRIDPLITRDAEVMSIVTAGDGAGSGLDADLLDGQHGAYYLSLSNQTGTLGVVQGGTGSTTASGARTNLGAASSGANSDITSLSGLTTPLSIAQGGTGSGTKNFVDLSGDQTVGGNKTFTSPIASNVATGTAPLQVASRTMVTNLNSELHGGFRVSDFDIRYGQAFPVQSPRSNTITTVDSTGNVGPFISITLGTDGLPVISYSDFTYTALKVLKCGNGSCSSGNTITTVDSTGDVGSYTSIAIGTDGLPVISYMDMANIDLKVVKCGNSSCSSGNTITTVDSTGDVGYYTSIAIGTDSLPVISYYDFTYTALKVLKCGNASCSSGNTITTVDSTGNVGSYTSITIGTDGLPVISYFDYTSSALKVLKCGNLSCSSGNTITTVDSTGVVGQHTSIAIGTDSLPVISYFDYTSDKLKVVKCGDPSCSSGNTITIVTVNVPGITGTYTSITIGTDGLPVISYYQSAYGNLEVVKCGNSSCSSGNTNTELDSTGDVGWYTSITIGTDGLPLISYYDNTNGDLKVLKCANIFCLNNWSRR